MKSAVLIASHIRYEKQIEYLIQCLISLRDQTVKANVFLSVSFGDCAYSKLLKEAVDKTELAQSNMLTILSDTNRRKSQMEHIKHLQTYVHDYDLIIFCDDDDMYTNVRVEAFEKAFGHLNAKLKSEEEPLGVLEILPYDGEFWMYGIVPEVLESFFKKMEPYEELLFGKYGDLYFLHYLESLSKTKLLIKFKTEKESALYIRRLHADNVCSHSKIVSLDQSEECIDSLKNNLLVALLLGDKDKYLETILLYRRHTNSVNDPVENKEMIEFVLHMLET
jgi:hypothetical protein